MGWANCGQDARGRDIGYAVKATCDHPGCNAEIDRGLAYACGGMHGNAAECDELSNDVCDGYFCEQHLNSAWVRTPHGTDAGALVCETCHTALELLYEQNDDGEFLLDH